jgi:hypothetical protein
MHRSGGSLEEHAGEVDFTPLADRHPRRTLLQVFLMDVLKNRAGRAGLFMLRL